MPMMILRGCVAVAALVLIGAGAVHAENYPVSGKWTYNDPSGDGPAKECGQRYMEFQGEQRFDKGGGVPSYRNYSVTRDGNAFQVVDQFATGQINARSNYRLRQTDADHIELQMQSGGHTIKLRRCQ
jgi:hypothetical protein